MPLEFLEAPVHVAHGVGQVAFMRSAVEDRDLVAPVCELADDVRSDEAGSPEDDDAHAAYHRRGWRSARLSEHVSP